MRKLFKKIESWIWIIVLVVALLYFHWLLGSFHSENEKLKESQNEFSQEIEEKYEQSRQLQAEIQAQLNEISNALINFFPK